MVAGVVNEAVVGENDALGAARAGSEGVDVALRPGAALRAGQQALAVAEAVAADAFAGAAGLERAAVPAGSAGFVLGDEVRGQMAVEVDIEGEVLLGSIGAVLVQRLLRRGGRLRRLVRGQDNEIRRLRRARRLLLEYVGNLGGGAERLTGRTGGEQRKKQQQGQQEARQSDKSFHGSDPLCLIR